MVIVSPLTGVVGPLPNGWTPWLLNGGDPKYLRYLGWSSKYQLNLQHSNGSCKNDGWLGRQFCPLGMVNFQGWAVKLPGNNVSFEHTPIPLLDNILGGFSRVLWELLLETLFRMGQVFVKLAECQVHRKGKSFWDAKVTSQIKWNITTKWTP